MDALIMSYALDTNGQNARFKQAADRWGTSEPVIKALALANQDIAGILERFRQAALKTDELRIRSVHRVETYMQFPGDIAWDRKNERLIRQLVDEADVIHLNNSYRPIQRFRVQKPMLLHHHGSMFRNNPRHMLSIAKGYRMTQAVSTLDLTREAPDLLHWLPTAYDIDWLQAFRMKHRTEHEGVRIVHCPTNREFKATDVLEAAVQTLHDEGLPVELVIVGPDKSGRGGQTWHNSLIAKANADIVFDQLAWGYGCNGVEAFGMGIPVVSGADDWTLARMRKEWRTLPFMEATADTLTDVLRKLVKSTDLRAKWGARGLAHVRKYHDEQPALARLAELYAMTIARVEYGRLPVPAVTFRSTKGKAIAAGVRFVNGEAQVTDPFVIAGLRTFAKQRPQWGIEEVA